MMHMTFYWGTKMTLLFDSWKTDSFLSYTLTLLTLFIFSVFYQYLEDRRLRFLARGIKGRPLPTVNEPLVGARVAGPARAVTAVLVGVNSVVAYMLMLAVMSFNWGVLIAVVVGFGVGYFCFRCREYEALVLQDPCACD
ncbi:hypothetical protein vseg_000668 [Gypsophila vaccaria]